MDGALVFDTGLDVTGFDAGSEKLKQAVRGLMQQIDNMGDQAAEAFRASAPAIQEVASNAEELGEIFGSSDFGRYMSNLEGQISPVIAALTKLTAASNEGFESLEDVSGFESSLDVVEENIERLQQRLEELGNTEVYNPEYEKNSKGFEKEFSKEVALRNRVAKYRTLGVSEESREWKNLQAEIEATEKRKNSYLNNMKSMEAEGTDTMSGTETEEYRQLAAALEIAQAQYSELQSAAAEAGAEMEKAALVDDALHNGWVALRDTVRVTAKGIQGLGGVALKLSKGALSTWFTAVKKAASGFIGVAQKGVSVLRGFASAIGSRLARSAQSAVPNVENIARALRSFRQLLITKVKETFISQLGSAFSSAVKSLTDHSATFNASMASMKNAMTELGANASVSFGNLVNAIAPFITQIVNALSQAVMYLNAFFALISGKGTMTVARKQTAAYGSSAGGAAKKVAELKREVYGFDELNKRSDSSDSDSGGGGGGAGGDLFREVAVDQILPKALRDYFEAIKAAIAAEEWEEVGGLIADGVNYLVGKLDEGILAIHDKAVYWTEVAARLLNGFVERLDWALIGKTIADGINLALDMANTFLTTFDFTNLGYKIAELLNAALDTIDWDALGELFANGLNGALMFLDGLLGNFEWDVLGQELASGVNTFWDTVDWDLLGQDASQFVDGVSETMLEFATGAHWESWGADIGTAVKAFFDNTDFTLAADAVSAWVDSICTTFSSLAENDEMWDSITSGVATFINEMIDQNALDSVISTIGSWVERFFLETGKLVSEIKWGELGSNLASSVNGLFDKSKWEEMGTTWGKAVNAVIDGAYQYVSKFDWTGAAEAVAAGVNGFFKETDFSLAADTFSTTIKGIFNSIGTFLEDVDWKQIGNDIVNFLVNIDWRGIAESMWNAFKGALKAAFNLVEGIAEALGGSDKDWNLGGFGEGKSDNFVEKLRSMYDDTTGLEQVGKDCARSIFNGLQAGFVEGSEITSEQAIQSAILIGQGFENELLMLSPELELAGAQFLTSVYNSKSVDELVANFAAAGINVSSSFADALGKEGYENIMAAITLLGMGIDEKTIEALDLSNLDANLKAYMESSGATLEEVAGELATDAGTAIGRIIPEATKEGLESGTEEVREAKGAIAAEADISTQEAELGQKAQTTGETITGDLASATADGTPEVEANVNTLTDIVDADFAEMPDAERQQAEQMMAAVTAAIAAGEPAATEMVEKATQAVLDRAAEILNSDTGFEIGNDYMSGLLLGLTSLYTVITTKAETLVQDARNMMAAVFNYDNGHEIGSNMMSGLADGIESSSGYIVSLARSVAQRALAAAKSALRIKSPSKAFAEVGQYAMEGWANGEDEYAGAVISSVADTAQAILNEADNGTIAFPIEAGMNALDKVADKLSSIALVFDSIAEALGALGGLSVPAIAAGTVIPYRTRISDGGDTGNEEVQRQSLQAMADQTDVMEDQRELLQRLIDTVEGLRLKIDGDSFTEAISTRQRANSQLYRTVVI